MNTKAFIQKFAKRELQAISGRKIPWNLLLLAVIFFLSLLAIGFANGSLDKLRKKMDSPFVRFVNVIIPYTGDGLAKQELIVKELERKTLRDSFRIEDVLMVNIGFASFVDQKGEAIPAIIRTVTEEDKFYKFIKDNPDVIKSDHYANRMFDVGSVNGWGCIVTYEFLERLTGKKGVELPYLHLVNYQRPNDFDKVPIPVCAVVDQLPDYADLLVSEKFLKALQNRNVENPFNLRSPDFDPSLQVYLRSGAQEGYESSIANLQGMGFRVITNQSYLEGVLLEASAFSEELWQKTQSNLKGQDYLRIYKIPNVENHNSPLTSDFVSIVFERLDYIEAFHHHIKTKLGLRIDLNTIEARRNFVYFNQLAGTLSWSLMGFGVLLAITIILRITLSHINRNKMNLGTLKAFGLSNAVIIQLYSSISILLVMVALIFGAIASTVVGYVLQGFGVIEFTASGFLPIGLGIVVVSTLAIIVRLWAGLRKTNPGDLIYGRA